MKQIFLFRKFLLWSNLMFFATSVFAQADAVKDSSSTVKMVKSGLSLGLSTGSSAIAGLDLGYQFTPRFAVRAGYNYLDYKQGDLTQFITLDALDAVRDKVITEGDIKQSNLALLCDLGINKKGSLRFTVGANYSFVNKITAQMSYAQNETYNEITLTPDEIGYIKGVVTSKSKINPYLGFGIGRVVPKRKFGIAIDMGAYYRGSPTVDIEATQLLRGNVENEAPLNRNLAAYKWLPIGTIRFTFRLK